MKTAIKCMLLIFIGFFVQIVISYYTNNSDMEGRIKVVESTMDVNIDNAIQQVLSSDDFYLDGFNYGYGSGTFASKNNVTSADLWVAGIDRDINMMSGVIVADTYGYENIKTYGRTSSELKTSNPIIFKRNAFRWQYTSPEFYNFYNWLRDTKVFGSYIYTTEEVDGVNTYVRKKVCTLDLMGLSEIDGKFDTVYDLDLYKQSIIDNIFSTNTSTAYKSGAYGEYMLTPTVLGITYINKKMLETVIKSNLELECACHYTMGTDNNPKLDTEHIGCTDQFGFGKGKGYYNKEHIVTSTENIINNGYFEIDLNSVDTRIEYRAIDMFDSKNNDILNEALGTKPGISDRAKDLKDNYNLKENSKYIVVAKVNVTCILHIPYTSSYLQLLRGLEGGASNHLDIQRINSDGTLSKTESGVLYKYSKYVAVTP